MEKDDKGSTMIRMGVSGRMFLLVPAYPGCPGSKAVKRSLLLEIFSDQQRRNLRHWEKAVSGFEGMLEIVGLGVKTEGARSGTHSESRREKILVACYYFLLF